MKTQLMNHSNLFAIIALVSICLGCDGGEDGRYNLSGNVTLNGEPVPVGELILEPDSSAGNQGPSSMSQIIDGKYELTDDQGIVGGSYTATILAFDGVAFGEATTGKPLLKQPYLEKVTFPKEDSTYDFEIE